MGYSFAEMKEGGYPPVDLLRVAGYSAEELVAMQYSLAELYASGYSFEEVGQLGCFTEEELAAAGYVLTDPDKKQLEEWTATQEEIIASSPAPAQPRRVGPKPMVQASLTCETVLEGPSWLPCLPGMTRTYVKLNLQVGRRKKKPGASLAA